MVLRKRVHNSREKCKVMEEVAEWVIFWNWQHAFKEIPFPIYMKRTNPGTGVTKPINLTAKPIKMYDVHRSSYRHLTISACRQIGLLAANKTNLLSRRKKGHRE